MREYSYDQKWKKLLTPDIVSLLSQIHEYKGQQALFVETKPETLSHLMDVAKIQSTEASNRIEGIHTSNDRLKKLVGEKTMPQNRNEKEIAGYRDVLATIHESHDYIPPKPTMILQLHRDLYKYSGMGIGGQYKNSDNVITEENEQGIQSVRFRPVPAWEAPPSIEALCNAYERALATEQIDPLLLIPMFVLDFLCIHPFADGNGRMSRLLTLLLLYRSGYIVGKYVSIEKAIEHTKETYYEALYESSLNWHENENDYAPFVKYLLGVVVSVYRDFASRVQVLVLSGVSKPERIKTVIKETLGKVTKAQLLQKCPDISVVTIQRTLVELQKSGDIIKLGGGRYTAYIWNEEKK